MIIDNKIYFGYGSILVGKCITKGLVLTAIKPPQPIGTLESYEGIEFGQVVTCNDLDQLCIVNKVLKQIDSSVETEIPFGEYIIVFIANSAESVKILRRAVELAIYDIIAPMAC
jgi:hypothetical protein